MESNSGPKVDASEPTPGRNETTEALQAATGFSTWRLRTMVEELLFRPHEATATQAEISDNYLEAISLIRRLEEAILTGSLVWRKK